MNYIILLSSAYLIGSVFTFLYVRNLRNKITKKDETIKSLLKLIGEYRKYYTVENQMKQIKEKKE